MQLIKIKQAAMIPFTWFIFSLKSVFSSIVALALLLWKIFLILIFHKLCTNTSQRASYDPFRPSPAKPSDHALKSQNKKSIGYQTGVKIDIFKYVQNSCLLLIIFRWFAPWGLWVFRYIGFSTDNLGVPVEFFIGRIAARTSKSIFE